MIRRNAYSWKCDRPAAFHGTLRRDAADATLAAALSGELQRHFATNSVTLAPGPGRGNHLTWLATVDGRPLFIRVENGPEADGHLAVESAVLERVRAAGVPTPRVYGCDVSRREIDFSWQALERIDVPDLNHWFGKGSSTATRAPTPSAGPLRPGRRSCQPASACSTPACTAPGRRMPTSIICGSTSTSRFLPGMA